MSWPNVFNHDVLDIIFIIAGTLALQIVGRWIIANIVRRAVKRGVGDTTLDERKREDTIIVILRTTYAAMLWIIAICSILAILGVNVQAMLTGAGLIGVIVGLSVQNMVRDLLAGAAILLEKQYRVGDIIALQGGSTGAGATGRVKEITLRITKLRGDDGTLITVRNGDPTVIINKTFTYSSVIMDVNVTYESDMAVVEKTIDAVGAALAKEAKWKKVISEPIHFVRIENLAESYVVVRAIGTVSPASQWDVAGEFRRRLLVAFAKTKSIGIAHN